MVESQKGERFITLASGLKVNGQPLVPRVLPLRNWPNPFVPARLDQKSPEPSQRVEPPSVATARVPKGGKAKFAA